MTSRLSGLLALVASATVLIAANEPPELPEIIASRMVDGRFEPGNFEYLRGYFPTAAAEEKAQYEELSKWLERCEAEGKVRLETELAEAGVTLEGEKISGASNLCRQVFRGEQFAQFETYDQLQNASIEARLVFNTLVETIRLSEQRIGPVEPDFARVLEARILGEQLLRLSFNWGYQTQDNPRLPRLTEPARRVFDTLVMGEMAKVDFDNTEWLKRHVADKGWPKYSEVGEKASNAAWLLAQHADHDPLFQLRALRLMEPLLAGKEVSPRNYAYLYDRVMLKLAGKQRYATQLTCENGERIAQPLEDAERVDELRAEVGLEPFAEYLTWFDSPCP